MRKLWTIAMYCLAAVGVKTALETYQDHKTFNDQVDTLEKTGAKLNNRAS